MAKRSQLLLRVGMLAIIAVAVVACGSVFARYLEMFSEDQSFQAKPLDAPVLPQKWKQVDDAYVLKFGKSQEASLCRAYLAVTEGVTDVDALTVELTVPVVGEATDDQQYAPKQTVTLQAQCEAITEGSTIYNVFGAGTVYRFIDPETGEERSFDLSLGSYTLTVRGLDSAAELASLLRFFVEYVP